VLGNFLKRLVNGIVLALAAFAFFLVPVGKKTAFQHFMAIFSSPPAQEAGTSFVEAGRRASASVNAEIDKLIAAKKPAAAPRPR
jgi:hypothetical protein